MRRREPPKRPILRIVADAGFEAEARSWAERLEVAYGPGPADLIVEIGASGPRIGADQGPGGGEAAAWTFDLSRARPGAEPVVRAVRGRRSAAGLWVVDATAGLGADAATLWRSGMRVTMIERDALVAALLEAAIERLVRHTSGLERLELMIGDSSELLPQLHGRPDVVYLDPMYPRRRGGAKRRGAAWLRSWLGERSVVDDEADLRLLDLARAVARSRVVVKRPVKAPPLAKRPSGAVCGSTTRFDIYAPESHGDAEGVGRSQG